MHLHSTRVQMIMPVANPPDYPIPTRPFHLLYAPDRRMTTKLCSFVDFALATFGPDA